MAFFFRTAGKPAAEGDLSAFTDGKTVSPWAKEAVIWAVEAGILQGSGGKLRPQAAATRAETAQLLWKLLSRWQHGNRRTPRGA